MSTTGPGYQPVAQPRKRHHRVRNSAILGGVIVGAIVGISAAVGGAKPAGSPASTAQSIKAHYSPAPPVATAPASSPAAPAAPAYTVSQQQAIASAKDYLSAEPGFSYLGLIGQLDSSAVGFSQADATFGVSTVAPATDTAFWDAQAAASAKDYMSTEPGWSACGLVGQLDSSAVQFTQAQAEYGAQSVGLGTC